MADHATNLEELLRRALGDGLRMAEPMRMHTTFRIGGPADFFYDARTPERLVAALCVGRELGLPVFLLGGGSNLLVSDARLRGLVVRNACARGMRHGLPRLHREVPRSFAGGA
jgi:UDP-N-acetylmuramate dehydrogenase